MPLVEQTVEVDVPVRTAYNQWTQFEDFPQFMEGVEEVRQVDDTTLHWVAEIVGRRREWDARIADQRPDQRIAWSAVGEVNNAGVVTFQPVGDTKTKVTLQLEYELENAAEKAGDALGLIERRIKGDMKRFKEFIESRGAETGAWRGEVRQGT